MAVDVDDSGTIHISDTHGGVTLDCLNDVVMLAIRFDSMEDTTRFYNAMSASIDVGCVHFHIADAERVVNH